METDELAQRCADILHLCTYGNIATCRDDQPWNTPATVVVDGELNFYWSSWVNAVHSRNVEANPSVFLTFYDSTRQRGTNNRRCLYLRCEAAVVTDKQEGDTVHRILYPDEAVDLAGFFESGLRRFYRARPLQAWVNMLSERQVQADTQTLREHVPLEAIRQAL